MDSNLYFNSEHLPNPRGEYVLWCDVMGVGRQLVRSMHTAANNVFRLHAAFSLATRDTGARSYAVMDGVYVTAPSRKEIRKVLTAAFSELARELVSTKRPAHMFIPRGGLAFGAVLHGADVDDAAFFGSFGDGREFTEAQFRGSHLESIRKHVLLSPAMVLAHDVERNAPPFGIFVDDSAQTIPQAIDPTDRGFRGRLYRWWSNDGESKRLARLVARSVNYYLTSCEKNAVRLGYPRDVIARHRELANEYFAVVAKPEESS